MKTHLSVNRRNFIKSTGIGLLAFATGNQQLWLTPAQAREQNVPFQILSEKEVILMEAIADILLPGATDAGVSHFIDQQLALPLEQCLLMIRYLGVSTPFTDFYKSSLTAMNNVSQVKYQKDFISIEPDQAQQLVETMGSSNPKGWQGPPAPFFYFVLRSDAVDVVYGTQEGFARLDIPYMSHIPPYKSW